MKRLSIPRFGLGGAALGNLYRARSSAEAQALLEAAWAAGVRHFDTAPHYGLGLSEQRLGAFLATKPRHEFVLSTKVGRRLRPDPSGAGRGDPEGFVVPATMRRVWDLTSGGVRRSLEESLQRLGLDRVDIAYLHDPERAPEPRIGAAMAGLAALRTEGVVARIGVGSMTPSTLEDGIRRGADIVMAANCYTLLDQGVRHGVLAACRETGARMVAAGVFHGGILSSRPGDNCVFDYRTASREITTRVRRIGAVCAAHGVDLPTAAMAYPLSDPLVDAVMVGADDPQQARQNLTRSAVPVPVALWYELDAKGLVPLLS
ncbi:aldo/keto reductase [Paractinoplanes ovalisporus]|uniref:aldo/keto reductase n=1 Tax=Paractinoplanes ovalisporus TaxID=2810368 RepID=UPI0027DBA553|nr:aldo/keto reductase [Actinoplanes ovalisporus]